MNELFVASLTAAWLGFLTAISPCLLTTNIAAISFVGRKVGVVKTVIFSGLLYSSGRTFTYSLLGFGVIRGILAAPELSHLLQKYMNLIMGPFLIVVAMFLLNMLSFSFHGNRMTGKIQRIVEKLGIWGSFAIGGILALSFCPISTVLFFGSLLPLAVKFQSGILLPALFGIATGLPVLVLALILAFSAKRIGIVCHKLAKFEYWAQQTTGGIFLLVGIVLTLTLTIGIRLW